MKATREKIAVKPYVLLMKVIFSILIEKLWFLLHFSQAHINFKDRTGLASDPGGAQSTNIPSRFMLQKPG